MAVEIANAVINLTPSLRGMGREIERQVRGVNTQRAGQQAGDGYARGFGGAAAKLTGVLGAAFAAVKIKDFAKDAIGQASDLNEVSTKLTAIFGDSAKAITDFGSQGAKALGQTSLEAENAAATFGTFGKAAGLSAKDNAAFSTELAKLATDMASFSNTTPGDAIEALGAGLRGESEPLRRYGVLLDDATLRTEAMKQGLITTTKQALTPQQKVLAAHAVIMKQTADAQGDFARTSGGLANQQRILSAQWTDAKGKLGQAFLPGVTAVVSAINERLFPVIDRVTKGVPDMVKKVSAAWAILAHGDFKGSSAGIGEEDSRLVDLLFTANETFEKVKGGLKEAWNILTMGDFKGGNGIMEDSPFVDLIFKVRDFGLDTFKKLQGIWDTLWGTAEKLWTPIKQIAGALFDAVKTLSSNGLSVWDILLAAFQKIADVLDAVLVPVLTWLGNFMQDNAPVVLTFVAALTAYKLITMGIAAATKAWTVVQAALDAVMAASPIGLVVIALAALAAAVVWAYNNVDGFREIVDKAWAFIKDATKDLWEGVLKPAFTWIQENIHYVGDAAMWLWNNAFKPAFEGIKAIAEPVFNFLKTSVENAITIFKGIIDFFSGVFTGDWSKAWDGIKKIFGGIWDQIKNILTTAKDLIVKVIQGIGPTVLGILDSFFKFMVDKGSEFLSWLWDGIKNMAKNVFSWFTSLPGWIWDKVLAALGWITQKGAEFLGWLWQGIKNKGVEVFNWFTSLPGWIWDKIKAAGSWILLRGEEFIGWIAQGIKNGAEAIWTFFKELPGKAWDALKNIAGSIIDIGKGFVGFIIDGIGQVASKIWDAIKDALTGSWGDADPGKVKVNDLGVQLGGARGATVPSTSGGGGRFFSGGILPGKDPGRRDNLLGMLPDGTPFGLRSEEAIMVPEFTRAVGGAPGVYAMNRLAEAGSLGDMLGIAGGFASGGVAGLAGRLAQVGADGAWEAARKLVGAVQSGGGFAGNGQWGPGTTNGFAANTAAAKSYIEGHFPGVASIGGLYGGSVPGSDHPMGKALDVMIANYLSQAGIANGTRIADWFINNPNSFGTKYVIWRDRINELNGWQPYQHPSGSDDTLQHRDHVHISFLTGSGQFAGGATNPVGDVGNGISGLAQAVAAKLGFGFGGAASGASAGGVERWRSTALAALSAAGQPSGYVNSLLKQMNQESSGDPNAINNTDSNAQRGDPSIGLMQVIGSTFRDTLSSHGFGAYVGKGQRDPFSNILAGILYTVDRYGDLGFWARNGYGPYDNGGMLGPKSMGVNLLNKPEAVLTPRETAAYQAHAASLANGSGAVVINLNNSDPLQVAVGRMIAEGVDAGMVQYGQHMGTLAGQSR